MFGPAACNADREVLDVVGKIAGPRAAVAGLQVDLNEHDIRTEPTRDHAVPSLVTRERAIHGFQEIDHISVVIVFHRLRLNERYRNTPLRWRHRPMSQRLASPRRL